jgi:hypothetical protein
MREHIHQRQEAVPYVLGARAAVAAVDVKQSLSQ